MRQEPCYITAFQYAADSPQLIEANLFIKECRKKVINSGRHFGKKEWLI